MLCYIDYDIRSCVVSAVYEILGQNDGNDVEIRIGKHGLQRVVIVPTRQTSCSAGVYLGIVNGERVLW